MDRERLDDALSSLTMRDLERLQADIADRLVKCVICGSDGGSMFRVVPMKGEFAYGTTASMRFCKPCFEKHRLPNGRAVDGDYVRKPAGKRRIDVSVAPDGETV